MSVIPVPTELRTERLRYRPWRADDAAALRPVLEANFAHLSRWIPAHVAQPAPLPELERRLERFADDFRAARNFRYAVEPAAGGMLLGEISMFPRSAEGRVALELADRVEIGYWLRSDMTGRGYATEAARAMLELAMTLPGIGSVEIHCDPRNAASAAIPRRLGFELLPAAAEPAPDEEPPLMLWACRVR